MFTIEEADYFISRLHKIAWNQIDDTESRLLILGYLLQSKPIRHYQSYKRNYYCCKYKSYPIISTIEMLILLIKEGYKTEKLINYIDDIVYWIRDHTIL